MEKLRGSRAWSWEPLSPPTVEKRTVMGHSLPCAEKIVCEAEVVVEGVGGSVVAVGAAALCVDDSLGDSFAVKV
ncbi:hypothetical protein CCMA1212_003891 [Trichoderma ghanense]|uniref:Uncharacterized protein n=1 Tax=Trichoderma ghanense TaxID=65468 RepID=A0ABY2H7A4_9HYPO